jgi:hypothetical protein
MENKRLADAIQELEAKAKSLQSERVANNEGSIFRLSKNMSSSPLSQKLLEQQKEWSE